MKKQYRFILAFVLMLVRVLFCINTTLAQAPNSTSFTAQQASAPVVVNYAGWALAADATQGAINIAYDSLGVVLQHMRLTLQQGSNLLPAGPWAAEKTSPQQLAITLQNPAVAVLFTVTEYGLTVASSSSALVLTAVAPAGNNRIVANVFDPKGTPVIWSGTNEVVENFGGSETRVPSYLPAKNPEVMTFTLGNVSSANIHALFDRNLDMAIVFSNQTLLAVNLQQPNLMDVTMPVGGNTAIRLLPHYYVYTLGLPLYERFNDSAFPAAPMVWGSWTSYYRDASEQDIVRNTDWLAANLKPYGFTYVQIDDGYDTGKDSLQHQWIDNWQRDLFPKGPAWMAGYIQSKGLHPGLWLVPNSYAGALATHPEWYLRDKNGKLVLDYDTPAIDYTHPGAQQWLRTLFTTLKSWGFAYFKFDGEFAIPQYAPGVDRTKLFDTTVNPVAAYRQRLRMIRDVVGPKTFIEGCPAGTPLNGIGLFNSYFNGADVYNTWLGHHALFNSINANAFLNHIAVYVMPGEGIDIAPFTTVAEAAKKMPARYLYTAQTSEDSLKGFGVTDAEARTMVSLVALTGVAYPLTSIMPQLPPERAQLLKMTMPTIPILPADLYSRGSDMAAYTPWEYFKHRTPDTYIHNYAEIIDLKVNAAAGIFDVVAATNWRSKMAVRKIMLVDKLGLSPNTAYAAFDFWRQAFIGIYKDSLTLSVPAHDTRVVQLHPLLGRPQLIGNSRHISGAYSILSMQWQAGNNTLTGVSETITGQPYNLYIYVPDGFSMPTATAYTGNNTAVPVKTAMANHVLTLRITGMRQPVSWQVKFKRGSN